jgi:hypothetical protein
MKFLADRFPARFFGVILKTIEMIPETRGK